MSRDWETLYYEQQASFTESNGMLCQERDAAMAREAGLVAELRALDQMLHQEPPDLALMGELLYRVLSGRGAYTDGLTRQVRAVIDEANDTAGLKSFAPLLYGAIVNLSTLAHAKPEKAQANRTQPPLCQARPRNE
jgi:hypothetical protein